MASPSLLTAARFKARQRLSLADALQQGAMLVHKDPEFQALEGLIRQEALRYKG